MSFKTRPLCQFCQKVITSYESAVRLVVVDGMPRWYHLCACWDMAKPEAYVGAGT